MRTHRSAVVLTTLAKAKNKPKRPGKYGVLDLDVACGTCGAQPKAECVTVVQTPGGKPIGSVTSPHPSRKRIAQRQRNIIREQQAYAFLPEEPMTLLDADGNEVTV